MITHCSNPLFAFEEQTLQYRMFVTEDLVIQFQTDFEPQADFSFVLKLISDGTHIISFNERLDIQSWKNGLHKIFYELITELNFKFEILVCVDYVNYLSRSSSAAIGKFVLKGSNDGKNWTTLIYKNGEIIYGKAYTEIKGCFRYHNLKIGYNPDDNKPGGVTLLGTQIDNNESKLTTLTPVTSSIHTTTGYNVNQNRWTLENFP